MNKQLNVSLKPFNSFGIDVKAKQMLIINDIYELNDAFDIIHSSNDPWFILGGGSNVLFTGDFNGTVIKISIQGLQVLEKTADHVFIRAYSGEEWDNLVKFCVENNWGGLENLSYIPGNVGASPIQNIGAYGVELKDHFHSLEAVNVDTGIIKQFNKTDCQFGYRDSIFKNSLKKKYAICSVVFRLDLNHVLNHGYKALNEQLAKSGISSPTINDVRNAVIDTRKSKLPDPQIIGSAGSFFKNPVIPKQQYDFIKEKHPGMIAFEESGEYMKIAAGWLIEQLGWKGYKKGDAGVYDKQALVIVNYGKASTKDILSLTNMIKESVIEKFGIELTPEVNII